MISGIPALPSSSTNSGLVTVISTSGTGEKIFLTPVLISMPKKYCNPLIIIKNMKIPHMKISKIRTPVDCLATTFSTLPPVIPK